MNTVWRVVYGISIIPPLAVFAFRMRMLNSELYRKGAIQKGVPLRLILKYYWRSLIGTCISWLYVETFSSDRRPRPVHSSRSPTRSLYDFVTFPVSREYRLPNYRDHP